MLEIVIVSQYSIRLLLRNRLESIQKRACRIILGVDYVSYNLALSVYKYQTLEVRIQYLC